MRDAIRHFARDVGVWSVGFVGRIKNILLNKLLILLCTPFAFFRVLWGRILKRLEIPHLDLVVGTACSLRCKCCANLMQYYKTPKLYEVNQILEDLKSLLNSVDYIKTVSVLGGEPLLQKELHIVVDFLLKHPKIGLVFIQTNGTIVPEEPLLRVVRKSRASIVISNYQEYSYAMDRIIDVCRAHSVRCVPLDIKVWRGYGGIEPRRRTPNVLRKIFLGCKSYQCKSLHNGLLHLCPRSAAGHDLGIFDASEDCVNVRTISANELRGRIRELLYRHSWVRACDYCDNSSACNVQLIPVAEQLSEEVG